MNPVLMIFIDGIGIGRADKEANPFFKYGFESFQKEFSQLPSLENQNLFGNKSYLFPVDACLGIEGLPQSGTGQTSIFCGVNAAKLIGKHFGPYPYSTLIPVIKEQNIFLDYKRRNKNVSFANAYPKVFFDYLKSGRGRLSVTSLSAKFSGLRLNRAANVRRGEALTAEITNERWNKKLAYNLPIIKPEAAAKRLLRIADKNSFTLYEYYLTDHAGHGRYEGSAEEILKMVDSFLYGIFKNINRDKMTLVVCSDHGNFEDLSIKTHTLNPAVCITLGKNSVELKNSIKDLSHIKPAILKYCA